LSNNHGRGCQQEESRNSWGIRSWLVELSLLIFIGKSCLVLRYVSDVFSLDTANTIGLDFRIKNYQRGDEMVQICIYDTAGLLDCRVRLTFHRSRTI
jgi:hypothetical protein